MTEEIWKDIVGYEGLYQVSNNGNVRRIGRRILKNFDAAKGYQKVQLWKENKGKAFLVHRLVLLAFVGQSEMQTNHINRNKKDNRLENLEYVHARENINHVYRNRELPAGVAKDKKSYRASIVINGKVLNLGNYKTSKEASDAYLGKIKELGLGDKYVR